MATEDLRRSPSGPEVGGVLTAVEILRDSVRVGDARAINFTGAGFSEVSVTDGEARVVVPGGGGGGAVDSVQGADGITPTTPQTGVVTLSGADLLPLDGSRPMGGPLNMGGQDIVNADAVGATAFNGVALDATGGGALFLADDGTYKAVPGGAVDSVQGADGITPTTPQTGVVTLSGADLLPLDGSRSMTGNLNMGGQDVVNAGAVGATTFNGVALDATGGGALFLADDGTYKAVPGGAVDSVQGADGITPTTPQTGVVTLSGADLLPLDGSRPMTGNLNTGANGITGGGSIGMGGSLTMSGGGSFGGGVSAPTYNGGSYNGVALTTGGGGTSFLADDGVYKAVPGGATSKGGQFNLNVSDGAADLEETTASVTTIGDNVFFNVEPTQPFGSGPLLSVNASFGDPTGSISFGIANTGSVVSNLLILSAPNEGAGSSNVIRANGSSGSGFAPLDLEVVANVRGRDGGLPGQIGDTLNVRAGNGFFGSGSSNEPGGDLVLAGGRPGPTGAGGDAVLLGASNGAFGGDAQMRPGTGSTNNGVIQLLRADGTLAIPADDSTDFNAAAVGHVLTKANGSQAQWLPPAGGGSATGGQETFNLGNFSQGLDFVGGTGSVFYVRIVSLGTFTATRMGTYIVQSASFLIQLGIYGQAGNLLGSTAQVLAGISGFTQEIPLTAPVNVVTGEEYFLAVWAAQNSSIQFGAISGRGSNTSIANIEQNLNSGLPALRGGGGPTTNRPYINILSAA